MHQHRYSALTACILLGGALLSGCATPAKRFLDDADRRGFTTHLAQSKQHHLVVLRRRLPSVGEPLHIYLDGDGTPILSKRRIASDPSSRSRLILDLIELDPAPSVLVGRPCYYQGNSGCDPVLWTDQRYSGEIVAGLAQAIAAESDAAPRITVDPDWLQRWRRTGDVAGATPTAG